MALTTHRGLVFWCVDFRTYMAAIMTSSSVVKCDQEVADGDGHTSTEANHLLLRESDEPVSARTDECVDGPDQVLIGLCDEPRRAKVGDDLAPLVGLEGAADLLQLGLRDLGGQR